MVKKGISDKGFIWIPDNCECKCNRSCGVGKHLDYVNFTCRKRFIDKLVEERSENIDEKKLHSNEVNGYKKYAVLVMFILYC